MQMMYDAELDVYDGLPEEVREDEIALSDVADEYGEPEASYLIYNGVLINQRDESITIRENRFIEADAEFQDLVNYDRSALFKKYR